MFVIISFGPYQYPLKSQNSNNPKKKKPQPTSTHPKTTPAFPKPLTLFLSHISLINTLSSPKPSFTKQNLPNTEISDQANRFLGGKKNRNDKKKKMSYLNRIWMAASVAVVQGHTDQGHKWKTGLTSLQHGKRKFFSGTGSDASHLRPLSGVIGSDFPGVLGNQDGNHERPDESLRRVMYLNCWGQG